MKDKFLAENIEKMVGCILDMDEESPLRQSMSDMATEMATRDAMDVARDVMDFVSDTRAEEETAELERQRRIRESEEAEAAEFERYRAEMRRKEEEEKRRQQALNPPPPQPQQPYDYYQETFFNAVRGVGKFFNDVLDATLGPAIPGMRPVNAEAIDLQNHLRGMGYEMSAQQCAQLLERFKTKEKVVEAILKRPIY